MIAVSLLCATAAQGRELRVCADPNNLPFSNDKGEGFENKIVELIAHRGIGEASTQGEFEASELIGLSELGLVGDPLTMASALSSRLGLELWDGTVTGPGRLAFVGRKARTLILSDAGRGWLPTGRPAEVHDVDVVLSGSPHGEVTLEASRYRIARRGE